MEAGVGRNSSMRMKAREDDKKSASSNGNKELYSHVLKGFVMRDETVVPLQRKQSSARKQS
jgi:hypothetical protein